MAPPGDQRLKVDDSSLVPPVWLVGVDGSTHARGALEWAARLAFPRGVTIQAVASWHYPYFGLPPMAPTATLAVATGVGTAMQHELSGVANAVACETGATIKPITFMGSPAQVLLERAEQAELVVVGSRGRGGFAGLVQGSVSQQLACHSPRPVVVVPSPFQRSGLRRAVVGVDGSVNSRRALDWVHGFAPGDCELVALHCWESANGGFEEIQPSLIGELRAQDERRFLDAVGAYETEVDDDGRFERVLGAGNPGRVLVEHAATADLLVVGARGRAGILGAVLGSTATWIVHHLPCPAAVIPSLEKTQGGNDAGGVRKGSGSLDLHSLGETAGESDRRGADGCL